MRETETEVISIDQLLVSFCGIALLQCQVLFQKL